MMRFKKSVVICCVCWRSRYEDYTAERESPEWRDLEELVAKEHLAADDYTLSQGYCPTCLEAFLQESHARQLEAASSSPPSSRPLLSAGAPFHRS